MGDVHVTGEHYLVATRLTDDDEGRRWLPLRIPLAQPDALQQVQQLLWRALTLEANRRRRCA